MGAGVSPVVRRRRLAAELRRLRTQAGRTLEEVAEYLECSATKVSRIETGQVRTRVQDVRELLDCYGVTGPSREALLELVRQSRQKGWWYDYSDMISEDFRTYLGLEDEAATIYTYETHLIPGLLQTEDYARAVMATNQQTTPEAIERGLQLRRTRQAALADADGPRLWAVIDEAALHRQAGGPAVMSQQYRHLIDMAGQQNIAIQVLPFTAGAHQGGSFPFTVLGFADPADPKVAYAELLTTEHVIDVPDGVGRDHPADRRDESLRLSERKRAVGGRARRRADRVVRARRPPGSLAVI